MGRCDVGMTKPGLDRHEVRTRLKQLHREAVSQKVRRDLRFGKRWNAHGRAFDGPTNEVRGAKTGQSFTPGSYEYGTPLVVADAPFSA
jgi:hypothetical protein